MDDFLTRVCAFVDERNLLPCGSTVIAGVSGGADSLALLLVLERLRDSRSLVLTAAHLHHGLRGPAADADEAFVRDWCCRLGIPCAVRRTDVGEQAARQKISLEDAGRQARLVFFEELAVAAENTRPDQDSHAQPPVRVALAHHLDDQAETLLLHLGRGCGLDGLTGMQPVAGRLIRPLLQLSRCEIESWLTGQGIAWQNDETNREPFALRNRLRLQVIPAWQAALGYQPAPLLARTAASLAEDRQLLDRMARDAHRDCRSGQGLRAPMLAALPPALQSRVLRLFWQEVTGSGKDLSYTHVQLLRQWLPAARNGQQLCLPGNYHVQIEGNRLLLLAPGGSQENRPRQDQPALPLAPPIPLALPDSSENRARVCAVTPIPQLNLQIAAVLIENADEIVYNDTTEYFQRDRINGCVVRCRQPGDRIHPQGRTGGKTLKKFLNEQKVPPNERDSLLLVALGHEVAWLPGLAAGTGFAGRPGVGCPGALVRLTLEPLDNPGL
jgi:tRNA(Ile)-lysidine synthase